jgi:group I intron endonuclease
MFGIYKFTSPSGRIYVGQSKDINNRYSYYKCLFCKSQPKLYRSFLKYGFESHVFEIIETCAEDELDIRERYYQELYEVVTKGLNCQLVASDNAPSFRCLETRQKISKSMKGRKWSEVSRQKLKNTRKGIKLSESHCNNIKLSKTGANNVRSKVVLNTNTGIFYDSCAEAAMIHGLTYRTLSRYLVGSRKNKTSLIYV